MKKNSALTSVLIAILAFCVQSAQAIVTEGEYYIVNDFFGKLLTSSSNNPRLIAYNSTNDAAFIFVAEASGTSGYVKLKHKSTGKYLTSSTSNDYSVLLSNSGSGDQYLWALDQRFSTTIINKRKTGNRLGCDFSSGSTYYWSSSVEVPVYYNKGAGALNWFTIIPSNGNGYEASRQIAKTTSFTNEYGVTEQDDYCVSEPLEINGLDYHIISSTPFESTGSVNLNGRTSWLIFENNIPSNVISNHLSNVYIDGAPAVNGTNCRVEIWLRGAAVIPTPSDDPFVATTDNGTFSLPLGNNSNLGENSNKARSFTLKRGYMATVASGTGGSDYSRVYVADHADLTVTLPTPLDRRVSSVYIRKWHYTSKAGYGRTSEMWNGAKACRASWAWNWDANSSSSEDIEYIPIKQHLYWPSDGNFYNSSYTAMMLFNEPEHSEQHTSSKCSCGGTISEWNAYTQTPKFNATGLRIGSPSATDLGWIKTYLGHCDDMKQRCDFSCTHGYWTSEWASSLNTLKGYGRPIWITEWEYGASWTTSYTPSSTDEYAGKVLGILDQLEYNDYVERYAYYPDDLGGTNGWMRELFWDNTYYKGTAPAGTVYKNIKPHFGYKASVQATPNWWAPSFSAPEIEYATLADGKYTLSVTNSYGDCTGTLTVQVKDSNGTWQDLYTLSDRNAFDAANVKVTIPSGASAGDVVRVVITSILSSATGTKESGEYTLADYVAYEDLQNLEFNEGTYISANVRTYAKDKTGTDTSGLNDVTGWSIPNNGDARSGGQFAWSSSYFLGASGYTAPATNSEGTATGGALGVLGVWTGIAQYVQNVYLEPGCYTMTIPVYNVTGGTTAITKNLFGFIIDGGLEYLDTRTTFPVNQWTTITVSFMLAEPTYGKISMGYEAANKGNGDMPHLFVDYVRITKEAPITPDDLQNLRFNDGTFVSSNINIGGSDEQKQVTGWTVANPGGTYHSGGQFAHGSGYTIGASGSSQTAPAAGSDEDPEGGALGMLSAWSAVVQYTQAVVLPAGSYTITAPVYNAGGTTAYSKNLIGFIADDGTEYLGTSKSFTANQWTNATVEFTLDKPTAGRLSVGFTSPNASSTNIQKLFVDYIQISDGTHTWPSNTLLGDVFIDGILDTKDVSAIVRIILGMQDVQDTTIFNHAAADVDGNGNVTLADVTALVNIILSQN